MNADQIIDKLVQELTADLDETIGMLQQARAQPLIGSKAIEAAMNKLSGVAIRSFGIEVAVSILLNGIGNQAKN